MLDCEPLLAKSLWLWDVSCTNGLLGLCPVDSLPDLLLGLKGLTNWGLKIPQHFFCGHPKRVGNLVFNKVCLIREGYMELLLVP